MILENTYLPDIGQEDDQLTASFLNEIDNLISYFNYMYPSGIGQLNSEAISSKIINLSLDSEDYFLLEEFASVRPGDVIVFNVTGSRNCNSPIIHSDIGDVAIRTLDLVGDEDDLIAGTQPYRVTKIENTTIYLTSVLNKHGFKGDIGDTGPIGLDGPRGVTGIPGLDGPKGADGPRGDTGPAGEAGDPGLTGPKGEVGPEGERGEVGDAGPEGPVGVDGPRGPDGVNDPANYFKWPDNLLQMSNYAASTDENFIEPLPLNSIEGLDTQDINLTLGSLLLGKSINLTWSDGGENTIVPGYINLVNVDDCRYPEQFDRDIALYTLDYYYDNSLSNPTFTDIGPVITILVFYSGVFVTEDDENDAYNQYTGDGTFIVRINDQELVTNNSVNFNNVLVLHSTDNFSNHTVLAPLGYNYDYEDADASVVSVQNLGFYKPKNAYGL